jgi:heat shock protein HtpX
MTNFLKTTFLLVLLTLLLIWCGSLLGGREGMLFAFFAAVAMNFGACWFSDRMVLSLYRAQPLSEEEAPEVHEIVRCLADKAGIPPPKICLLPSASANAFATGRGPRHAAIAVTHGIVTLLNQEELEGVLGHEMSHILNRDILLSTVVATLAGALGMIAGMFRWSLHWSGGERDERSQMHPIMLLLFSILMPLAATLIQLAISRSREYEADKRGGELCGNPLYLASALRKIEAASARTPLRDAQPATAHLFIMNPLSGKGWSALFSTHPPVGDRIARLEDQSRCSIRKQCPEG